MSAMEGAPAVPPEESVTYWAPHALLPFGPARNVRFTVVSGRFTAVETGVDPGRAHRLCGVVLPGMANAHSHAFHRALRGRTHDRGGSFWTWRDAMYRLAERLDPDSLRLLARAVYAEMALAGITTVGEFHYLHHGPEGRPYADPNAMGEALRAAAQDAGVRLTLLDTCYLTGGLESGRPVPLEGVQLRFGDVSAEAWGARVADLPKQGETFRIGLAVHSVRAVPPDQLAVVRDVRRDSTVRVLHAHVSEQPAENGACLAAYGRTPTAVLADAGLLDDRFTAVHAVHLTNADVIRLGTARATVCACPTTERDLADGIAPVPALLAAGAVLSLGSDQQVETDLLAEARAVERHARLTTLQRGRFTPPALLAAATHHGSLGWDDVGALAVGQRADLVAVRLDSVRTAGIDPTQLIMVAGASDVDTVVRDGRVVVESGQHRLGDVGRLLDDAITPLWETP